MELQGVVNFRDCGGYQVLAPDGAGHLEQVLLDLDTSLYETYIMERDRLYRCGNPGEATRDDVHHVVEIMRIRTMVDLRSDFEATEEKGANLLESAYHPVTEEEWVQEVESGVRAFSRALYRVPLMTDALIEEGIYGPAPIGVKLRTLFWTTLSWKQATAVMMAQLNDRGLLGLYQLYLTYSQPQILKVLQLCTQRNNFPMMIYCSAGKDRTGLLIALIQALCNVRVGDIMGDYHFSHALVEPIRQDGAQELSSYRVQGDLFMGAPTHAIRDTFIWLAETYGGVSEYLVHIGFDEEDQQAVRNCLVGAVRTTKRNDAEI